MEQTFSYNNRTNVPILGANNVPIEKCVGRIVDIIYQDSKGKITKRQISVHRIAGDKVRVFDTAKQSFRSLSVAGILAVQPVSCHAG
jgi:hypothetical protein